MYRTRAELMASAFAVRVAIIIVMESPSRGYKTTAVVVASQNIGRTERIKTPRDPPLILYAADGICVYIIYLCPPNGYGPCR